jgi:hypothetical protein
VNTGLIACRLIIETLETELTNARHLLERYEEGGVPATSLLPIRHFCAGLVETAVELSRGVADQAASSSHAHP